jgi:hypothetical protein
VQIVLPGTTNYVEPDANISAYIDLPNGLISSKTNLTVEVWATPIDRRIWQHFFEFGLSNMQTAQTAQTAQTVSGRARQERFRPEGHNRKTPCC